MRARAQPGLEEGPAPLLGKQSSERASLAHYLTVTVWLVSVVIFAGIEALPGDACTAYLERDAQGQLLENCRKKCPKTCLNA